MSRMHAAACTPNLRMPSYRRGTTTTTSTGTKIAQLQTQIVSWSTQHPRPPVSLSLIHLRPLSLQNRMRSYPLRRPTPSPGLHQHVLHQDRVRHSYASSSRHSTSLYTNASSDFDGYTISEDLAATQWGAEASGVNRPAVAEDTQIELDDSPPPRALKCSLDSDSESDLDRDRDRDVARGRERRRRRGVLVRVVFAELKRDGRRLMLV
ncbi:hypothetical protein C8R44DRAFT_795035 [Mycena epipterygia]|nr:hypothetical protein C8R44DRAFT_795035 [Mycena epipterygia]